VQQKKLICYVTGGLGNRVLPLSSLRLFAELTNRQLYLYWPLDFRCGGHFSEFYDDEIISVDESFLRALPPETTEVFCRFGDGVDNDYRVYHRSFLWDARAAGRLQMIDPSFDNEVENIICCTNTFLTNIPQEMNEFSLRNLHIKKDILQEAEQISQQLGLDKKVLGVHLRGTDYNLPAAHYAEMLRSEIPRYSFEKIFICSDDATHESHIEEHFSNTIRRKDKIYIKRNDESRGEWTHNTNTTSESLRDTVIDILLLAKTNFKIYNKTSSFARYAEILAQ